MSEKFFYKSIRFPVDMSRTLENVSLEMKQTDRSWSVTKIVVEAVNQWLAKLKTN